MQKTKQFLISALISISIFLVLVVPVLSLAADSSTSTGLVPCTTGCSFKDLLTLVNNIINFILKDMVIPIAAIMFAYAGFELVTSGGSTEKRGIANRVFTDTVLGLVIALAAWLIIKLILSTLGYSGPSFLA